MFPLPSLSWFAKALSTLIRFKRKRSCFAPFSKRFASTLIVFVSFSPVYTTTPYLLENAVIPSVRMVKWTRRLRISIYRPVKLARNWSYHSRPQSPRSFWPVAGIESSGRTRFSEYAQSIRLVFSTNQIWWEVREPRTSGVRPSQSFRSLPQARRIVGSGDENAYRDWTPTKRLMILSMRILDLKVFPALFKSHLVPRAHVPFGQHQGIWCWPKGTRARERDCLKIDFKVPNNYPLPLQ